MRGALHVLCMRLPLTLLGRCLLLLLLLLLLLFIRHT